MRSYILNLLHGNQTFSTQGSLYLKHTAHSFDFVNRHCANTQDETQFRAEQSGSNFESQPLICRDQIREYGLTSVGNMNAQEPLKSSQLQANQEIGRKKKKSRRKLIQLSWNKPVLLDLLVSHP